MIALLFQSMPAKTEKSFDKFLKSDHTNNWAVLVREKKYKTITDSGVEEANMLDRILKLYFLGLYVSVLVQLSPCS